MPAGEVSALLTCLREKKTQGVNYRLRLQGVGNWFNTAIILICLAAWGQYNPPYSASDLQGVWRTSTGLGLVPIIFMLWWRIFKLKESGIWKVNMTLFVTNHQNNENYILFKSRIIYLSEFFPSVYSSIKKAPAVGIRLCCAPRSLRGFVYLECTSGSRDTPGMCFQDG